MGLARSLAIWLTGTTAGVLGVNGWLQVRQERHDLYEAAATEVVLLATTIRTGVENALRDEQHPDVRDLLEQPELKSPGVDVFVFDADAKLLAGSWGSRAAEDHARAVVLSRPAAEAPRVEQEPDGAGLIVVAPLRVRGATVAQLVVMRPTDALDVDLAAERRAILLSLAVLLGSISCVLWLVVRQRLHHPMSRLIAGIRRLSRGDLSARIRLSGGDEISEIAREFDAMASALEESRRCLLAEAEKREQLERDMQRANKLAIVGQLATMLAHEIGSPLQVLNGRARVLATRADLALDARQSAEILVEQTDRVDRIIQRLLGVARRNAAVMTDVHIDEPVEAVLELLSNEARRRGLAIQFESGQNVPSIRANVDQVQQVMLNLVQNALRACSAGGVVRIRISRSSFRMLASGEQASVAVAVEDTGIGVPEHMRAQIFEPFHSSWSDGSPRTGLGLSVVNSILVEHGGVVTVEAGPLGKGARFTVHFPVGTSVSSARAEAS